MGPVADVLAEAWQHYHRGLTLRQQGQLDGAIEQFREALRYQPNYAQALNDLGHAYVLNQNLVEAEKCFAELVRLLPSYPDGHNNLGNALAEQSKLDEAAAAYRQALALDPRYAEAHYNLANTLKKQAKVVEAAASYRQALAHRPDYDMAYLNLGNIELDQHHVQQAAQLYNQALTINPGNAEAHTNLGLANVEWGRLDEAVACHRRALELKPGQAQFHINLGDALSKQGRLDEAIACFRRGLKLQPDNLALLAEIIHHLQRICLWPELNALSQKLIEAVENHVARSSTDAVSPFAFLALPVPTSPKQQLQCATKWVEQRLQNASGVRRPVSPLPALPRGGGRVGWGPDTGHRTPDRINIGYLSADFQEHPVASLLVELIEKHDRSRFAVFGYSYGADDQSPMRRRLVKAFDRFVDVRNASSAEAAALIAADGVDILVDLMGYTQHARIPIMALQPAPIQINFLGYPGTMGAPFIDYILVDDFIVPPDQQPLFSEKLVHLPGSYQVNDSQRLIAKDARSKAESSLPEEGFIFCCFNNSYKITPDVFEIWMRLLKNVPGSVLWLLEDNPFAAGNLHAEAQTRGVARDRLVFAPRLPQPQHLARHRVADIFLDTFPYNAHTTASDALWAGCPVLTLAGQSFASRVAGSLLRTLGLPELITTSLQEYEAVALRLAQDAGLLADLRARLEVNRTTSGLFDGGRFARDLEQAYLIMWQIHAASEEPRAIAVGKG